MKPANFPARKNARRQAALYRLPHRAAQPNRTVNEADRERTAETTLTADPNVLRGIRTKKPLLTGSAERRAHHDGKLFKRT